MLQFQRRASTEIDPVKMKRFFKLFGLRKTRYILNKFHSSTVRCVFFQSYGSVIFLLFASSSLILITPRFFSQKQKAMNCNRINVGPFAFSAGFFRTHIQTLDIA
ncbi:uncharacterized protein SOCG_05447 [Schizosaccharomyces octosporus yFS286]|uniref:Transmembrane protein n=1 Tax=Schizosaccharomyces octosporus (strain yFS286) TaxID=483514 RepID=S9PVB6_SCHOY|nr:uncharacterized protein SOCG_05447 [Schizosaccharomyces octosporus yFS286]EPX71932.1 hypothetical protein SOCG_05447 [Schizosaccharomyces octosporus yFS286]